jgi:dienelactone hydrolase
LFRTVIRARGRFLTYLTENLASKGYVVAAIDHTDSVFGQQAAFTSTLLNRSSDQWFTIEALQARTLLAGDFLNGSLDASRVAIVGYSMGGYGALASAGAGYSKQGGSARIVPGGYFRRVDRGQPTIRSTQTRQPQGHCGRRPVGRPAAEQ